MGKKKNIWLNSYTFSLLECINLNQMIKNETKVKLNNKIVNEIDWQIFLWRNMWSVIYCYSSYILCFTFWKNMWTHLEMHTIVKKIQLIKCHDLHLIKFKTNFCTRNMHHISWRCFADLWNITRRDVLRCWNIKCQ